MNIDQIYNYFCFILKCLIFINEYLSNQYLYHVRNTDYQLNLKMVEKCNYTKLNNNNNNNNNIIIESCIVTLFMIY